VENAKPCRSWLASEGGLKPCSAHEDAFASKPAPTRNREDLLNSGLNAVGVGAAEGCDLLIFT
jgi:hypothetical protein